MKIQEKGMAKDRFDNLRIGTVFRYNDVIFMKIIPITAITDDGSEEGVDGVCLVDGSIRGFWGDALVEPLPDAFLTLG